MVRKNIGNNYSCQFCLPPPESCKKLCDIQGEKNEQGVAGNFLLAHFTGGDGSAYIS
jgi:hypothetical protein